MVRCGRGNCWFQFVSLDVLPVQNIRIDSESFLGEVSNFGTDILLAQSGGFGMLLSLDEYLKDVFFVNTGRSIG